MSACTGFCFLEDDSAKNRTWVRKCHYKSLVFIMTMQQIPTDNGIKKGLIGSGGMFVDAL